MNPNIVRLSVLSVFLCVMQPLSAQQAKTSRSDRSSSQSSAGHGFDGTWRQVFSKQNSYGTKTQTVVIMSINGTHAELTTEATRTLAPQGHWNEFPDPYKSVSPLYTRVTNIATDVRLEDGKLTIHWSEGRLTDWRPKTLPYEVLASFPPPRLPTEICEVKGNELVIRDPERPGWVSNFQRVK